MKNQISSSAVESVMNSRGKFTPGPWKVIPGSRDIVSCGDILKRRFIAEALESTIKSDKQPSVFVATDLEVDANARLIAASPELLAALKTLGDWPLGSSCFDGTKAKNAAESLANVRRFARAAIAKAEGVQP